jgi:hypothetical protein
MMVVLLVVNLYRTGQMIGYRPKAYLQEAGEWMQEQPELKGKVIYNISWDSFPELMLYRSDCDYIWGMDPMFTAAKADRNSRRVIGFMQNDMKEWGGSPADAVRVLRDDFHADYIFVHDRGEELKRYNEIKGWSKQGLIVPVVQHVEYGFAVYRIPPAD